MYPDYRKLKVRPASSIPLHPWALESIAKPRQTVHMLSNEEFQEMRDRLTHTSAPPIPPRPTLSAVKGSPDDAAEPIYDFPPDAKPRPVSIPSPTANNRYANVGLVGVKSSGADIFDVPPRRSVKRDRRVVGRRAVSDLQLNKMSHRCVKRLHPQIRLLY